MQTGTAAGTAAAAAPEAHDLHGAAPDARRGGAAAAAARQEEEPEVEPEPEEEDVIEEVDEREAEPMKPPRKCDAAAPRRRPQEPLPVQEEGQARRSVARRVVGDDL